MNRYIVLLFCLAAGGWLRAQPLDEVPAYMMIETAEASMALPDYYTALEWYENAYKETRDPEVANKIAELQFKLRDYSRAERWLERIVRKDMGELYPDMVFLYAQTLKINGKLEDAIDAFNHYAGLNIPDSMLVLADNEVAGIQLAMASKPPIDLVVKNAGRTINYSYSDGAPYLSPEGVLYFSSMRTREIIKLDGKEGDYYLKIYTAEPDKDKGWKTPKAMGEVINRIGYHTGNPSISPDGNKLFFTRSVLEGNALVESKIFVSKRNGSNWSPPVEIEGINGDYVARHPVPGVLFGKEVLFFSSDMPGGYGGFDIYYADRIDDTRYAIPVNLGPAINTGGDEITPFYLNNKLYFSSTGLPGFGGFDIFRSDWDGRNWGKAENLGAGYNSPLDDMHFSVNEDGKVGFLVSNRPDEESRSVKSKTCCDDIYQFHIRDIVIDLVAIVFEGDKPLPGAKITVFEVDRGKTGKSQQQANAKGNEFQFPLDQDKAYKALVERDGYNPIEFEFNTVGIADNHTIRRTIKLSKKPDDGKEIVTINEAIRLNNIYYEFDDDKILPDAEKDLQLLLGLMKQYPDMVIELASHTDAQGNDAYNERLSQRRAQSAKNWLVRNGVSERRIEAVGYGESQILNHCINGIDCTDDEHRVNRRTEFKIISGPTTIEMKKSDLGDQKKNEIKNSFEPVSPTRGTVPASEPKIMLAFDKMEVKLGQVRKGDKREMVFNFTNAGNQPIEIELVTSCECTTLEWPQFKIFKPGDKGQIKAIFDSTEKEISETTDIEVILKQHDPKTQNPIVYRLQYNFDLVK